MICSLTHSYHFPSACPLPPPGHPACTFCLHSSALGTVLSAPWIPSSSKCYPLACPDCTPHPGPAEGSFHRAPWMGLSSVPADPTRASWLPCQPRLPILPSALASAHPRSPHSSHRSPLPPSGLPISPFTFRPHGCPPPSAQSRRAICELSISYHNI